MKELHEYTQLELCEIYDCLNRWQWDDRAGEKPAGFDGLPRYNIHWYHKLFKRKTKIDYLDPVMDQIKMLVPRKEMMRHHHLVNLGNSNEDFEKWWRENEEHDPSWSQWW